ncbi:hypothetical protein I6J39_34120 (plasmid) [Streptomyces californicus]|uniref:Uncharacterized protein n=1 Tax=Streptomyces californicus TaxID=67351 RepID=A0ABX7JCE1_9ACTN|nr:MULTISPECIES: hypothetical protein [Streptomyces]QRV32412.1 hypothetical protein I6J39_34120 [Streptomyces californicus]QRV45828.1 hypothetical protein I6J41_34045 [Streptomyces californicus]
MTTPETPQLPELEDALAQAIAASGEIAAALEEASGWQPIWKRPRTPKPKAARKEELEDQRERLQDAGKRRLAAGESRRPRPRQSRIGNAAARRDARALSRLRHSNVWLR